MKKNLYKSFSEAPSEIQVAAIRSRFGVGISFTEYQELVLKYPEYFNKDEVEHIQKLKDEKPNNIDSNNTSTTEL